MKRFICLFQILLCCGASGFAAPDTLRVLFVGNSYVQVNNLPDIVAQMAANQGDVLLKTDVSVGGYTLKNHFGNPATRAQISQKGWDYVILQEQSQLPSFPDAQVAADSYPFARALDSLVHKANPCAKTVFYMTWGRKNGDAGNCPFFPLVCTYKGMDSLLRSRYSIMAQSNKAVLSPVGAAWHKMRDLFPAAELYQTDESHPSEAGSYLAAATFYTILFKKNPTGLTYNFNLSATDAANIRNTVRLVVWDSLSKWYQHRVAPPKPRASFSHAVTGKTLQVSNTSLDGIRYQWLFGDGQADTSASTQHTYASNGSYTVRLIAINCDGIRDTASKSIVIGSTGVGSMNAAIAPTVYPNPARGVLNIDFAVLPRSVQVFDLTGKICLEAEAKELRFSLDISRLAKGSYLLQTRFLNGEQAQQLIVISE